jgi:rod shape-determining protein MreD
MIPYLLFLSLALAALVQVSLMPSMQVAGVWPDLALVIVVAWTLLRGARSGIIWALVAGAWLDLTSGGPFGMYTLGLIAATLVAGLGGRTVFRSHVLLALAMVAAATVVQNMIQYLLIWLTGAHVPFADALLRLTVPEVAYNMIVMLLVYPVLAWVNRVTERERLPVE